MATLDEPVACMMTPDPATVDPAQRLSDARRLMHRTQGHHVPVCENGRFIGLLAPMDLVRVTPGNAYALDNEAFDAALDNVSIRDAMQEDVVTIDPREPVRRAAEILLSGKFHSLPVVDEQGALVGIVTTTDLIGAWLAGATPPRP